MKKIIPVIFALLVLTSCAQRVTTPDLKDSFTLNAVYKSGDYSYSCKITKTKDYVSITPTSTNAAGMVIKCDGKTVTYTWGNFEKTSEINKIDVTNPARILYEVFSANLSKGNTSAGSFEMKYSKKLPVSIDIASADISVSFKD